MPALGLGTWQQRERCAESVRIALETGYRHVDTAAAYGNEQAVGDGIDRAAVDRDRIFVATKVWHTDLAYEDVIASAESSLNRLGTEYFHLLYVHWPANTYDPAETLPAFDDLRDRGLIRHVGVSNFEPAHIERAEEILSAPIAANRVELHPYLPRSDLRTFADQRDLSLVAYTPLARGALLEDDVLGEIASAHDATPAQIALAWLCHHGIAAIPKATGEAHIRENYRSLELELSPAEVGRIDAIDRRHRVVHPSFAPAAWD
ncbi:MAG: aldo/keto reductase [Salinirussus sp.]